MRTSLRISTYRHRDSEAGLKCAVASLIAFGQENPE